MTTEAPKPGSDEYNKQMAERLENGVGPRPEDETRDTPSIPPMPQGGREKFYDKKTGAYNWEAHAREVEWQSAQKNKKDGGANDDKSKKDGQGNESADTEGEVKNIIEAAGLKVDDLANQIRSGGDISAEAKAALVKSGIPQSLIDEYVALANANLQSQTNAALAHLGGGNAEKGEAEWKALSEWAEKNLSDAEKTQYNKMLSGPEWKVAIDTLQAKRRAASPLGREGRLFSGNAPGNTVTGYSSKTEMIRDMQSDKYKTDPAFRAQVRAKVAISKFEADGQD